mgnify:CR=1 FL=1
MSFVDVTDDSTPPPQTDNTNHADAIPDQYKLGEITTGKDGESAPISHSQRVN